MLESLIATGATFLFPAGRALKLVKNGVNLTNSMNPLILTKNITLTVLDCCAPPPVRLAAHLYRYILCYVVKYSLYN